MFLLSLCRSLTDMFKLEIGEVPVSTETGGTTELSINLTPIPIL